MEASLKLSDLLFLFPLDTNFPEQMISSFQSELLLSKIPFFKNLSNCFKAEDKALGLKKEEEELLKAGRRKVHIDKDCPPLILYSFFLIHTVLVSPET